METDIESRHHCKLFTRVNMYRSMCMWLCLPRTCAVKNDLTTEIFRREMIGSERWSTPCWINSLIRFADDPLIFAMLQLGLYPLHLRVVHFCVVTLPANSHLMIELWVCSRCWIRLVVECALLGRRFNSRQVMMSSPGPLTHHPSLVSN